MFERARFAVDLDTNEFDHERRPRIGARVERLTNGHRVSVELLQHFTQRRLQQRLAGLELASGKFPQTAVSFVRWPSTQQQPLAYCREHADWLRLRHRVHGVTHAWPR